MNRLVAWLPLVLLFGIVAAGCDAPAPVASAPSATGGPPAPPPPPAPPGTEPAAGEAAPPSAAPASEAPRPAPLPVETKAGVFAGSLDDLAAPVSAPAPTPAPETERVKAEKGVGIKGRSLDEYEGVVVTPAKTLFAAKERIAFEIAVPQALNLYKASDPDGKGPATHEDFMEKVVKFNNIKLPELPPGHKYVYDPTTEQLMVERPKRKAE